MRLAVLLLALALPIGAAADPRPVVVEFFTSQGCSSCPPADALLRELAPRRDVVALGFHIAYWDSLGWKDPFSRDSSTERQKAYAWHFNGGQVYTPQAVVDGMREMVGSERAAVLEAIDKAKAEAAAPVNFAADRRSVAIGSGTGSGKVLLVRFAQQRTTRIGAGENSGRVAQDANGVTALATLGAWNGSAQHFDIAPPAAGEGVAILVQAPDGKMLGAAVALGSG